MNEYNKAIKRYLDEFAKNDAQFAAKYENSGKTIEDCCNYIIGEVKKMKRECLTDPEVYGMAIHFYDEESIKAPASVPNCRVVVTKPEGASVVLSADEQERLKHEAQQQFITREIEDMQAKKIVAEKARKARSAEKPDEKQGSLF